MCPKSKDVFGVYWPQQLCPNQMFPAEPSTVVPASKSSTLDCFLPVSKPGSPTSEEKMPFNSLLLQLTRVHFCCLWYNVPSYKPFIQLIFFKCPQSVWHLWFNDGQTSGLCYRSSQARRGDYKNGNEVCLIKDRGHGKGDPLGVITELRSISLG